MGSTNDHSALLRKRGILFAPALVLTGHQTAGRGRGAHVWWSGNGCLTATFIFPIHDHHQPHQIPLLAGLAVRNAVAEASKNDEIQLKWPNDVLFHGQKLAGLLCERILKADLVGIGLNINLDPAKAPRNLRERVSSLSSIAGHPLDMTMTLALLAKHLHATLGIRHDHPFSHRLKEYDNHHALVGRRVSVLGSSTEPAVSGRCEGLDSVGRLLLRDGSRLHRIISGQVLL